MNNETKFDDLNKFTFEKLNEFTFNEMKFNFCQISNFEMIRDLHENENETIILFELSVFVYLTIIFAFRQFFISTIHQIINIFIDVICRFVKKFDENNSIANVFNKCFLFQ